MKKVMLSKTALASFNGNPLNTKQGTLSTANSTSSSKVILSPGTAPAPVLVNNTYSYQMRKLHEPAYKEIFNALLSIPDKLLRQRVIDALNGSNSQTTMQPSPYKCPICSVKQGQSVEVATQTEEHSVTKAHIASGSATIRTNGTDSKHNGAALSLDTESSKSNKPDEEKHDLIDISTGVSTETNTPKRKRRRRKVCLPQVVKRSQAQETQEKTQPKLKIFKRNESTNFNDIYNWELKDRQRSDSLSSIPSLNLETELENISPQKRLVHYFKEEFIKSEHFENGLLPIHQAVLNNDIKWLRRQIVVLKTLKQIDLNELLTEDDETSHKDCLQLAISNDSYPVIIRILLEEGLNSNYLDEHSNTVIHMALLNEVALDSMSELMRHIDLNVLLRLNDDGYTPLHLAVRQNCFLLAERMLNALDERLLNSTFYKRSDNLKTRIDFLKFYENACKHLDQVPYKENMKRTLLNAGEMRSGNTALFYAIKNNMEHLIYFLLAHLTDPRIQNHSGQDVKSFFGEFSKILNLNLNIDRAMDKVIEMIE